MSSRCNRPAGEKMYEILLNPIKDVGKNWEVNITASLQNYLSQIESNFAQAGLVLQGSAHVFGRKVDHLHNLVYLAFRNIAINKRNKNAQTGKNHVEAEFSLTTFETNESNDNHTSSCNDNQHKSNRTYQDFMPLSLIPKEDCDKGDLYLCSENDDQLGNCMDFRLFYCQRDSNGTCLLSLPSCPNDQGEPNVHREASGSPHQRSFNSGAMDNSDDEGIGGDMQDDPPLDCDPPDGVAQSPQSSMEDAGIPHPKHAHATLNFDVTDVSAPDTFQEKPKLSFGDPHSECKSTADLHPVHSTFKLTIPERLLLQNREKNHRKRRHGVDDSEDENFIWDFCDTYYFFGDMSGGGNTAKQIMERMLWSQERKIRKKALADRKKLFRRSKYKIPNTKITTNGEEQLEDYIADNGPCVDSSDDEREAGSPIPDLNDFPNDFAPANAENFWDEFGVMENGANPNNIAYDGTSGNHSNRPLSTYEEMAKQHLEKYRATMQKFQKTTDITRRVNEWRDRVTPFLDDEAQRESFDINIYGSRLLSCFEANNRKQTIGFSQIVADKKIWEVPRYFLTSLLLTNQGNLDISVDGELKEAMDTMSVTLLSRRRVQEDLNAYCTAPDS